MESPLCLSTSFLSVFLLWKNLRLLDLQRVITRYHRWARLKHKAVQFRSRCVAVRTGLDLSCLLSLHLMLASGNPLGELLWLTPSEYEFCWTWWTSSKIFILSFTESCVWQVPLLFSQMRNESRFFQGSLNTSDFSLLQCWGLNPGSYSCSC